MQLYLDDDSVRGVLIRLLQAGGHDVLTPSDAGIVGEPDPSHLMCAIQFGRCLLTHNHNDFKLVLLSGGHHPGVLVVRRDNDPTRDMSPKAIVRAIQKLLDSAIPLSDSFHILNHWR